MKYGNENDSSIIAHNDMSESHKQNVELMKYDTKEYTL